MATAARLLHALGHRVRVVTDPGAPPIDPHILLPRSALQNLAALRLHERVTEVGRPVSSNEIHWGTTGGDLPGRDTGLQVAESALARVLVDALTAESIPVTEARVASLLRDPDGGAGEDAGEPDRAGGGVHGVRLEDGTELRAPVTLVAVPALLRPEERPRAFDALDAATTVLLEGIDPDRFRHGHHFVETYAEAWAWALRHSDDHVQLTLFHEPSDEAPAEVLSRLARPSTLVPDAPRIASAVTRIIRPSVPSTMITPGLVPMGRAALGLSPLSSLGTSVAIQGATTAAAVAASHLAGHLDGARLDAWYRRELTQRALRTHALVALACTDPAHDHDTAFWHARGRDFWKDGSPDDLVNAALRSRAWLFRAQHRTILGTWLEAVTPIDPGTALVQEGPQVVERPVRTVAGGLPIPDADWTELGPLHDRFAEPDTLPRVATALLSELPPDADRELARKRIAQRIGRLHEAGFLRMRDDLAEASPGGEGDA